MCAFRWNNCLCVFFAVLPRTSMNGWKCLLCAMAELWVWRISFVSTVSVSLVIACRLNGRKADEFNRDGLHYQFENFRLLYVSLVWIFDWKAEHIPSCQGEGSVIEGRCYFVCCILQAVIVTALDMASASLQHVHPTKIYGGPRGPPTLQRPNATYLWEVSTRFSKNRSKTSQTELVAGWSCWSDAEAMSNAVTITACSIQQTK